MNTPVEISSLTEFIDLIEQISEPGISYLYRGQENAVWKITSSAYRRLLIGQPEAEPGFLADLFAGYLNQIVDEIQLRYPSTYKDLFPLECMAHLQHNKVATGLIDFTKRCGVKARCFSFGMKHRQKSLTFSFDCGILWTSFG